MFASGGQSASLVAVPRVVPPINKFNNLHCQTFLTAPKNANDEL